MTKTKTHEQFLREVEELVGKEYTVKTRYKKSREKLLIKHEKCGEVYPAAPTAFLRGNRCPKCAGRKIITEKEFKLRVEKLVGDEYDVLGQFVNTSVKIRMKHNLCGEEYEVRPRAFTHQNSRCPKCYGNKKYTTEEYMKKITELTSGEFEFVGEYHGGRGETLYKHIRCGTTFTSYPNKFHNLLSCTECGGTKGERAVSHQLKRLGVEYKEEKSIGGRLRADFYLPKYQAFIEFDGLQHYKPIEYWGGEEAHKSLKKRDLIKDHYCSFLGMPLLRIPYWEIDNVQEIVEDFVEELEEEWSKRKEEDADVE